MLSERGRSGGGRQHRVYTVKWNDLLEDLMSPQHVAVQPVIFNNGGKCHNTRPLDCQLTT